MIFRPFYYFDFGCAAYLFGCGTMGRCAVVDPRADGVPRKTVKRGLLLFALRMRGSERIDK